MFKNEKLNNEYEHFLFVMEGKYDNDLEDIEKLQKFLKEWKVPTIQKEYVIGIKSMILEWDHELSTLQCKYDGHHGKLLDHTREAFSQAIEYLPDFFSFITDKMNRPKN